MIYLLIMPNFWIYLVLLAFYFVGCVSDSVFFYIRIHIQGLQDPDRDFWLEPDLIGDFWLDLDPNSFDYRFKTLLFPSVNKIFYTFIFFILQVVFQIVFFMIWIHIRGLLNQSVKKLYDTSISFFLQVVFQSKLYSVQKNLKQAGNSMSPENYRCMEAMLLHGGNAPVPRRRMLWEDKPDCCNQLVSDSIRYVLYCRYKNSVNIL